MNKILRSLSFIVLTLLTTAATAQSTSADETSVPCPRDGAPRPPGCYENPTIPLSRRRPVKPYNPATRPYKDQLMTGYQGWFTTANDGAGNYWGHWSHYSEVPRPGNVTFENYPDVREYQDEDLFYTDLGPLGNGEPSRLFSSARAGVVDTHFRWMKEYDIDGAVLQRFAVAAFPGSEPLTHINTVSKHVKKYAEIHGRSFYVSWDISGFQHNGAHGSLNDFLKRDLMQYIEGELKLTSSTNWAKQDGKPVIGIWGIGFGHNAAFTAADATELITWLKNRGYFVMGGVPHDWRTASGDWLKVYKLLNVVQPWAVGNHPTIAGVKEIFEGIAVADKKFCDLNGMIYQRVIYPGFAWSNWNGGPRNGIARENGKFFWAQAYYLKRLGATGYIAMFDEYDEGTAIAKTAENASMLPRDQWFFSLDFEGVSMSSDFYLRLAGAATKLLRGEIPLKQQIPIPYR